MKRRVLELYQVKKTHLKDLLLSNDSKISYTSDIWSSPNQEAYMCITAHYIDEEWVLHDHVIAFRHLLGSHTGEALAAMFLKVLAKYLHRFWMNMD